jgi:BirA family biotin operon repressor/biotin-[acetyl-CoA-carboxylase] ligase
MREIACVLLGVALLNLVQEEELESGNMGETGSRYLFGEWHIIFLPEVISTNAMLSLWISEGKEGDRTVLVSSRQTGGVGRLGRTWNSPEGGLWCSLSLAMDPDPRISLCTALAVCKAVSRISTTLEPRIKWPNDVLTMNRKVCGILCELLTREDRNFAIVGIGINVNNKSSLLPPSEKGGAISLSEAIGKRLSIRQVLENVLEEEERVVVDLHEGRFPELLKEITRLSATIGQRVKVTMVGRTLPLEGVATMITQSGTLVISLDDGSESELLEGDVEHLQSPT